MNARFQTRIQRYGWDKAAAHYESGWKNSLEPAQKKLLELAAPQPAESVMDLACGTGLVTFPLAAAVGPTGRVVATDLSDRMVEAVRQQASRQGATNVEVFRADAESLHMITPGSFDIVTCALGLMYCPAPINAMREAFRILKPGGRAVFAVWGARENCGWAEIFPIVDRRVNSTVCPMFFRLGTGQVMMSEMTNAGFTGIDYVRLKTVLSYRDGSSAADAAFIGGPVALAYNRFDDQTREAARADYLVSISSFKEKGGYAIPAEFVVCRGTKFAEASGPGNRYVE